MKADVDIKSTDDKFSVKGEANKVEGEGRFDRRSPERQERQVRFEELFGSTKKDSPIVRFPDQAASWDRAGFSQLGKTWNPET